jgi:precorrin-8X/cobalt-precorrin-8 methylmutase
MKVKQQNVLPNKSKKRSFEIIRQELGDTELDPAQVPVLMRVIHTTADFDYVDNLIFSPDAVSKGIEALKKGAAIVTDTQMAAPGSIRTR